jgi:hypothetical protein
VDVAGVLEKITLASETDPSEELQSYFSYFLEMLKEEN